MTLVETKAGPDKLLVEEPWSGSRRRKRKGLIWFLLRTFAGTWSLRSGYNYPDHPYLGVPIMIVFYTLTGAAFGWFRLASSSVWVAAVAHTSANVTMFVLPFPFLAGGFDLAIAGPVTSVIGWIPPPRFGAWLIWTRHLPALDAESLGIPSAMAMVQR